MSDASPEVGGCAVETDAPEQAGKVKLAKNYWRLWTSSVISNLGDDVTMIALPWFASAVTRNAFLIALSRLRRGSRGSCSRFSLA